MSKRFFALLPGLAAFAAALLMIPRFSYDDPDTFWHYELGRYMIDHRTILHHAIHTFYGDRLPYIPHEYAFQIVLALLVRVFGWPGAYLLTASCLLLTIAGMDRLARVSRRELGLDERRDPVLLLILLPAACWVYYCYFTIRPQMVSAWMIVWFFVYLREFRHVPRIRFAVLTGALSLGIANFHAGIWPVAAVFTVMAAIEALRERQWTKRHAWTYGVIFLAGLLNPGGLKSLLFIFAVTKGRFNLLINEWQPIEFSKPENLPILLALMFFAAILPFALRGKLFRYLFMLGILYLGVSSYKQNLFLWLFLPYFAAALPDSVPMLNKNRFRLPIRTRWLLLPAAAGLVINAISVFAVPPTVNAGEYPVKEMDYILRQAPDGVRPRVMAPYGASGYVMYRGGDVLCDGRQDPFVTDESKGALGWNAFQRSMYGFGEYLPEIVASDHPDYVIARSGVSAKLLQDWTRTFGEPAYRGDFGVVFRIGKPTGSE
ncbi:hypothetical protein [Cohnella caldifontis]|uniref:hypothetical protein n=1 Tax=Cohnella caldifontis TaxID=3027471 RepID=UPI0023EAC467|nr:hypothetical protein [Cohnella sp. YIM B05605]